MKTTLDIQDVLLQQSTKPTRYELPDCSVGDASASNRLESWSWQDLRDEIYTEPTAIGAFVPMPFT